MNKDIAAMSAKRGQIYQTFINIFMCLPDEEFRAYIYSDELQEFLSQHKKLQYPLITKGIGHISSYLQANSAGDHGAQLENLAVDRTKLIRVPHNAGFRAPYEGQYLQGAKSTASLRRITNAYRKAGFVPAISKESPDFFCVELDFMRVLSNRIATEPAQAGFLLSLQKEFLEEHLGNWVCSYAEEAARHAGTDFYRGWLMILQGFIEIEKNYLQSM